MHKLSPKGPIPEVLRNFCRDNPDCRNWDHFYDNHRDPYRELKRIIFSNQNYLCAYCEDLVQAEELSTQRIEHFHPKEDTSTDHNWTFDWNNMIGVCMGGSQDHPTRDLHCDAKKEQTVTPDTCDGFLLNPLDMPTACLFDIDRRDGKLRANETACASVNVDCNHFSSVRELVENTIEVLNLNCDKLNQKRLKVIREYDRLRKNLRRDASTKSSVRSEIAKRWFSFSHYSFFTTRRILLGTYAEEILTQQGYNG